MGHSKHSMPVTPHDIGLLLLFASFIGIMVIAGRVWCVATIIAAYSVAAILPLLPAVNQQTTQTAGLFVLIAGLCSLMLRKRLLWRLTPSSLGSRLWALPLALASGGLVFYEMLQKIPWSVLEEFSFGTRALFLLPVATVAWKAAPLVILLLLQSRRSAIQS